MHELGIAQSILTTVLDEKRRLDLDSVEAVAVRIGALSGVLPDALQFSFEAIRTGTPLADCHLSIEPVPVTVRCSECDKQTPVENFLFVCQACGSSRVEVISGYELDIAYLEVAEDADNKTIKKEDIETNGRAN